jgi:single-strand DNA-binding protein|nr:MAG TPA: Single strand binding protein [Caudoviricetes sp.]
MSLNLNKVILAGRLTKDSELRTTQSGTPVTQFDIAVNRRGAKDGQQPQTDFITVVAWRQTAEFITRYFKKGNAICVVGSIQTRSYTDKNNQKRTATEVVADEAYFVESKTEANPQYAPTADNAPQTAQNPAQQYYMQQAYTNAPAQQMSLQGNTVPQAAHETSDAFSSEEELPF